MDRFYIITDNYDYEEEFTTNDLLNFVNNHHMSTIEELNFYYVEVWDLIEVPDNVWAELLFLVQPSLEELVEHYHNYKFDTDNKLELILEEYQESGSLDNIRAYLINSFELIETVNYEVPEKVKIEEE